MTTKKSGLAIADDVVVAAVEIETKRSHKRTKSSPQLMNRQIANRHEANWRPVRKLNRRPKFKPSGKETKATKTKSDHDGDEGGGGEDLPRPTRKRLRRMT